jgi:hypothetical protein
MHQSAAFTTGYDAYLGPMKERTNPYPDGTPEHSEWWAGFNSAQADCAI